MLFQANVTKSLSVESHFKHLPNIIEFPRLNCHHRRRSRLQIVVFRLLVFPGEFRFILISTVYFGCFFYIAIILG